MENLRVLSGALEGSPLYFFLEILEISLASTLPTLMEMYWKWLEMTLSQLSQLVSSRTTVTFPAPEWGAGIPPRPRPHPRLASPIFRPPRLDERPGITRHPERSRMTGRIT